MSARQGIREGMLADVLEILRPEIEDRARGMAGWSRMQCSLEARRCGDVLACGGDRLLVGPPPKSPARPDMTAPDLLAFGRERWDGATPGGYSGPRAWDGVKFRDFTRFEVWDALVTGLALGSLCPGGVTWLGVHFCTAPQPPHAGCAGGEPL